MKNLTLSVDEADLAAARRYTVERNTTVNRLVREYLKQIGLRKERERQAIEGLLELAERSTLVFGSRTWTRDDLHER